MDDQEIKVDININSESLKQIPQLKTSIDGLKKEILNYNTQASETIE